MLAKLNVQVFFAAMLACAWPVGASAQQLPLRYLTQQDGLGNLTVNALAQDQTGYLWAGTDNGLFRYNGAEFQRFGKEAGLIDTRIAGMLADTRQRLWVGTFEGFYQLDGTRLVQVLHEATGWRAWSRTGRPPRCPGCATRPCLRGSTGCSTRSRTWTARAARRRAS
jgi:ligand-binding sensor domain-containing protein